MEYNTTGLDWVKHFSALTEAEQKVLVALSHDRWKWRSKKALESVTRLESSELDRTLANLVQRNIVSGGLSESGQLLFALAERVGSNRSIGAKLGAAVAHYSKT